MPYSNVLSGASVDLSSEEGMTSLKHCGSAPANLIGEIPKFKIVCQEGAVGRFLMISKQTSKLVVNEVEIQVRTESELQRKLIIFF